jgi:hypothetical protein
MQEIIYFQNKHWQGTIIDYPIKRDIYQTLEKNLLSNKLILSIEGPRRVGKSILIKQLITFLINKEINVKDIFYFSYDDFKEDIFKLLKEYELIRKKSINDGEIFFFFDEIQKISNWQEKIKIIYDNYPNIKIIVSGSTLRINKKESLAGRIFEYFVPQLSFKEYLSFSNNSNLLNAIYDDAFINQYKIYLKRQYPELAINSLIESKDYVTTIIKKVIYEDSIKYYPDMDVEILLSLFKIILKDPGQIIDYTDLANEFGTDRKLISKYLDYLINSGLVRKTYHFSNNARKVEKMSKKFYPFCTTLISFVNDNPNESKLIETDVAFQLNAEYFWDDKGTREIDFIIYDNVFSKKIGVEVKYKNQITTKDINNFKLKSALKLNLDKKYLIIKDNSIVDFDSKKEQVILLKYYLIWRDFNK